MTNDGTGILPVADGKTPRSRLHTPLSYSHGALAGRLGIFGKDFLHYMNVVFALCGFLLLLIMMGNFASYNLPVLKNFGWIVRNPEQALFGFLVTLGFVMGIVLGVDEEESGTRNFLDRLPIPTWRILLEKMIAGIVLTLIGGVIAFIMLGTFGGNEFAHRVFTLRYKFGILMGIDHAQPFILLHALTMIATGLAAGTFMGSLTPSAIAAALSQGAFMTVFDIVTKATTRPPASRDFVQCMGLVTWTVLVLTSYPWILRAARERTRGAASNRMQLFGWRFTRAYSDPFATPEKRLVQLPAILYCASAILIIPLYFVIDKAIMLVPFILGLLYGSGAWMPEECRASRFLYHWLPATRTQIYCRRTLPMIGWSVIISALASATVMGWLMISDSDKPPGELALFMFVCMSSAVVGISSIASFVRLFHRLRMVTLILAAGWSALWLMAAFFSTIGVQPFIEARTWTMVVQAIWCSVLLVGIPWVCGYIAFCHTTLLEQNDGRRGALGFAVFPVVIIWGGFLMAMSPVQLFEILFL